MSEKSEWAKRENFNALVEQVTKELLELQMGFEALQRCLLTAGVISGKQLVQAREELKCEAKTYLASLENIKGDTQ